MENKSTIKLHQKLIKNQHSTDNIIKTNSSKRLLIIEIPDYLDLSKDFKTESGFFNCHSIMKEFNSYIINPTFVQYNQRLIEGIIMFIEQKDFLKAMRSRFSAYEKNNKFVSKVKSKYVEQHSNNEPI